MKLYVSLLLATLISVVPRSQAQQAPPYPAADDRYKVDILEVVGHPDDDIEVAAYVAKLIEQQHKKVAVVYMTRGNSGGNAAGPEQANALADIREMEARQQESGPRPPQKSCRPGQRLGFLFVHWDSCRTDPMPTRKMRSVFLRPAEDRAQ